MNLFSLRSLFLLLAAPVELAEATPAPTVLPVAEAAAVPAVSPVDWSLIIAVAALAFSLVSPVLSAWITGRYQLKLKRLELRHEAALRQQQFYDEHRAQVIETYITTAGAAIRDLTFQSLNAFGQSAGEIYLYLPEKLWPLVEAINEDLTAHNAAGAEASLTALCKKLSAENVRPNDQGEPKRVDNK